MKGKCCRGIPNQVGDNKEEKYHSEGRKNVGRNLGGEAVGWERKVDRFGCQTTLISGSIWGRRSQYTVHYTVKTCH